MKPKLTLCAALSLQRKRIFSTGALFTSLLCATPAFAASFDCAKASTETEQAICNTPSLGELDSQLTANYKLAMSNLPASQLVQLRGSQLTWLKTRNACHAQEGCLKNSMEQRSKELTNLSGQAGIELDDAIRAIPANPLVAAQKLREYSIPLASAWLVYLHQFVPASKVADAEATQRYQMAEEALGDSFPHSLLTDIEKDPSASENRKVLTLLRMTIENAGYGEPVAGKEREYAHCFIFKQQGQDAYESFGSLYGSSMDSLAPICAPQGDLFQRPAWVSLMKAMAPALEKAGENAGTIRFASYADWRMFDLRVTVSPQDFLKPAAKTQPKRDPEKEIIDWDEKDWSKRERDNVLTAADAARQTTAKWLQEEQHFSASDADKAANTIVQNWLSARLDFL